MVFREDPSYDIFVDLDPKGQRHRECDTWTAESRVSALNLYDCSNELLCWAFRSRALVTFVREKATIFAFHQGSMKLKQ